MTGIEYLVGAIGITVSVIVGGAIFTYFEIERHAREHVGDADDGTDRERMLGGAAPPRPRSPSR